MGSVATCAMAYPRAHGLHVPARQAAVCLPAVRPDALASHRLSRLPPLHRPCHAANRARSQLPLLGVARVPDAAMGGRISSPVHAVYVPPSPHAPSALVRGPGPPSPHALPALLRHRPQSPGCGAQPCTYAWRVRARMVHRGLRTRLSHRPCGQSCCSSRAPNSSPACC